MVVVQFTVKVPDAERFKRAYDKLAPLAAEDGASNQRLYQSESDPSELTMMAEWESHDAMHASSEKRGDDFNAEAGTEGLDWTTRVWHPLG